MLKNYREYIKYLMPFILAVLIYSFISNYTSTVDTIKDIMSAFLYIANPFLIGFVLAYMLDFLVSWFMTNLKFKKWLAIMVSFIILLGAVASIFVYIIPIVYSGIQDIALNGQVYYENLRSFINHYFGMLSPEVRDTVNIYISKAPDMLLDFLGGGVFSLPSISNLVSVSARVLVNLIFGFLICLYALIEKEQIIRIMKKTVYALTTEEKAEKTVTFFRDSNEIFSHFVVGKLLDSLIVGIISLILYLIFGLPLAPFLAVVAAVFNMIPYFGPWIGGGITVILLLCINPITALYALIISFGVQTIDATFLNPKLVGSMVGISPLLTIVAIAIGGDVGGLLGMFFGVPVIAILKLLIFDKWIERKTKNKIIPL